jgi:hypothetical protein
MRARATERWWAAGSVVAAAGALAACTAPGTGSGAGTGAGGHADGDGADGAYVYAAISAPTAYCSAMVTGSGVVDVETDYLPNVVNCENGGASLEALKAQAVSARSFLYYKLANQGYINDGTGDQVYSCGSTPDPDHYAAVAATSGQVLMYDGVVIAAFFVAGALQSPPSCTGGTSDPTSTEQWVTYNWGNMGASVVQTPLGWVSPANDYNRGCLSQNGSHCLSDAGWTYDDILRFYYGMDIALVTATGPCVMPGVTPTCTRDGAVVCGAADARANDAPGSTDVVTSYGCNTWGYAGPEYAYAYHAETTEPVTVTVTGLSADLDLFVLDGDTCDPFACVAASDNSMTSDETVTFDAVAGADYSIVVDGYNGNVSGFTISFACTAAMPPPPPVLLPALSLAAEVADIDGQSRDFAPDGDSAGIFDLYDMQPVTVRLYFTNDAAASGPATGVVAGVWAELPFLGIGRWDLYTDDPAAGCGAAWCPDAAGDAAGQPPHDDPGSDLRVGLGDIARGETKMVVVVAVGLDPSIGLADHPDVRGFVAHADGVYDKADFWAAPALNVGQDWNGGDLRAWAETDVWEWTGEGLPPGAENAPPVTGGGDPGSGGLRGACGCRVVGAAGIGGTRGGFAAPPAGSGGLGGRTRGRRVDGAPGSDGSLPGAGFALGVLAVGLWAGRRAGRRARRGRATRR